MARTRIQYVCQQCGRTAAKPLGRCPQCGAWNSMQPEAAVVRAGSSGERRRPAALPQRLADISDAAEQRIGLPMEEFSRVLGGGVVPGSVTLIGGDPGIGKSTLLLQVAAQLAERAPALYVSGEESDRQIKSRAGRLGGDGHLAQGLYVLCETEIEAIADQIQALRPALVVVDSIQTMYGRQVEAGPGTITQVRESAARLVELAKASDIALFLVGHVTKDGALAGPRVLEHMVDTVLYLEGDPFQNLRLLRSVKNRFGPTTEVGVFQMARSGMVEVRNPSEALLADRAGEAPGSAIAVIQQGTRALLVEVQGLTSPTAFGHPRRTANGIDFNRLLLIVAVLTRRVGLRLADQDVFANVAGGIRVTEPAADLAVAMAIASSVRDRALPADTVLIGEVGLSAEVRPVAAAEARVREAAKLGFRRAVLRVPARRENPWPATIEVLDVRSLREALEAAFGKRREARDVSNGSLGS